MQDEGQTKGSDGHVDQSFGSGAGSASCSCSRLTSGRECFCILLDNQTGPALAGPASRCCLCPKSSRIHSYGILSDNARGVVPLCTKKFANIFEAGDWDDFGGVAFAPSRALQLRSGSRVSEHRSDVRCLDADRLINHVAHTKLPVEVAAGTDKSRLMTWAFSAQNRLCGSRSLCSCCRGPR